MCAVFFGNAWKPCPLPHREHTYLFPACPSASAQWPFQFACCGPWACLFPSLDCELHVSRSSVSALVPVCSRCSVNNYHLDEKFIRSWIWSSSVNILRVRNLHFWLSSWYSTTYTHTVSIILLVPWWHSACNIVRAQMPAIIISLT